MSKFGWSLPPGCGTLPGEEDEQWTNQIMKEAFADYDSPAELARIAYKYTDCGPWVSFQINGERWVHSGSHRVLGTWEEMDKRGELVTKIMVGSIVEGVDCETDEVEIKVDPEGDPDALSTEFWEAISAVNSEAESIWQSTHGCPTCAKHWLEETSEFAVLNWKGDEDERWDVGDTQIWAECPDCSGFGTII